MEEGYAPAGVQRFLVDGPALRGDTAFARTVGTSDVVCFGRDLPVTYRVWSPRSGYPGRREYRDFHTYDHSSGLKPSRVTGRGVPSERKKPYDPALAAKALRRDAADFVTVVRNRLTALASEHGRPSLVVAAYDTELFGHWWFEGPEWLGEVLRALPEAGVRVTTLRGAVDAGLVGGPVALPASSWGSGKDWRVWDGERVAPLVEAGREVQHRLLGAIDDSSPRAGRDRLLDGLARQALLALSSDWAFMVTKDSAADYALARARSHSSEVSLLADLIEAGQRDRAARMVAELDGRDTLFGGLDARGLARPMRFRSRDPEHISRSSVLSGR
jgi:1,4-alpha-glucan branching enzyme